MVPVGKGNADTGRISTRANSRFLRENGGVDAVRSPCGKNGTGTRSAGTRIGSHAAALRCGAGASGGESTRRRYRRDRHAAAIVGTGPTRQSRKLFLAGAAFSGDGPNARAASRQAIHRLPRRCVALSPAVGIDRRRFVLHSGWQATRTGDRARPGAVFGRLYGAPQARFHGNEGIMGI